MRTANKIFSIIIFFAASKIHSNQETIIEYQKLLSQKPNNFELHFKIGELFFKRENYSDALVHLQKAHTLKPDDINALFQLGCVHVYIGNVAQAIEAFEKVLVLSPNNPQALYNIAYALKMDWQMDKAIKTYQKVLELCPNYEPATFGLGFAYLQKDDFEMGWKYHEIDLKKNNKNSPILRDLLQKKQLFGKTIVLKPEGGLGDTIMFIRYAQCLKRLGAKVIAMVQKPLIELLSRCPFIDEIISTHNSTFPPCDDCASLMSLPAIFNSNEQTIPKEIPYIFSDPVLADHWQKKLSSDSYFKIGICWQADVFNDSSRTKAARRGIPLSCFYELTTFNNISLYSLQQYDGIEQLEDIPQTFKITVFEDSFDKLHGSFMDTAAVMQHLDLIITVDSAIAHLAGALGKKVWLLLPYATDWRWIAHRKDSPWYPTMRIFHQPKAGDWQAVMNELMDALTSLLHSKFC